MSAGPDQRVPRPADDGCPEWCEGGSDVTHEWTEDGRTGWTRTHTRSVGSFAVARCENVDHTGRSFSALSVEGDLDGCSTADDVRYMARELGDVAAVLDSIGDDTSVVDR